MQKILLNLADKFKAAIIMVLLVMVPAWAAAPPYTVEDGVRVIKDQNFTSTIDIDGLEWNGAVITKNTFIGQVEDGIVIANASRVRIENNTFRGVGRFAIKLNDYDNIGATDITIIGNRFESMPRTAILVGLPNNGVRIIDNLFLDVAWDTSGDKQHAMYIKASGYLVEGNRIDTVRGANGISIRNAGVVRRNWVTNVKEDGIKYYSDQPDKGNGRLLIENNVVTNSGHGGIAFAAGGGTLIDIAVVRLNTLVNNYFPLRFDYGLDPIRFLVYGNILVEGSGKYVYGGSRVANLKMSDNLESTTPAEFFSNFQVNNVQLKTGSPAIHSVRDLSDDPFGAPKSDLYGIQYHLAPHDAGAAIYYLPSPTGLKLF